MIKELQVRVDPRTAATSEVLRQYVARQLGIDVRTVCDIRVLRRSIDARQRNIQVNLSLRVFINEEPADEGFVHTDYPDVSNAPAAVVVGAGPGGLFAALRLIELGVRPIVVERGKDVHERKRDLSQISRTHTVDPESNYCFGEGGAGAYSDGKLYTRSKKRGSVDKILNVFCQHGASLNILADAHPHIGTDRLPRVIENMRKQIITSGGEVHFQTRMDRLVLTPDGLDSQRVVGIEATRLTDGRQMEFRGPVILATGHSARDVYRYLSSAKIHIEAKGIAVGVRLEHPSQLIDQIQYHSPHGRGKYLPAAEYSFVTQVDGRGVYSFCMCPGGFVIPAATGPQQLVVNGMSPSNRAGQWSNSGMVVELHPEDVSLFSINKETSAEDPLCMLHLQEQLEYDCWQQGGMKQTAPAQRMMDFVNGKLSYDLPRSSYAPGLISSPLHFWMPEPIRRRLQEGFKTFGRQRRGFLTNEAQLIAIETRTSAPVRISRSNDTLQHVTVSGLFPCGEGAGYAGGIVSAGIDGERCAEALKAMM